MANSSPIQQPNFKTILWFADRASAAYQDEAFIKKNFINTIRVNTLTDIDVQYFVEYDPAENIQTLTIRGTANFKNAKEDADYVESKNKNLNIFVHKGFDGDAHAIYQDVLPFLKKSAKTRITGHSLGAAIATLLMMYLHHDDFKIEHSFNFGQPKVTNKDGVKAYNFLPLTRIVDEKDVVPLVPPITLLNSIHGFYEHLGDEIILLKDQFYHYLDEHNSERLSVGSFWRNIGHESIKDHFMDNYISHIKTKVDNAVELPFK